MTDSSPRWAFLYPGDRAARDRSDPAASRFAGLFRAFAAAGVPAEPAIYHDDFCAEVEAQLRQVRGVLVWHNPVLQQALGGAVSTPALNQYARLGRSRRWPYHCPQASCARARMFK